MKEKFFLDTNLIFYCSGNIGYRWAVKVMEIIAKNKNSAIVDALFFQEILDRFDYLNNKNKGEMIYKNARKLLNNIVEINVKDFDNSYELYKKYSTVTPRLFLRIATMKKTGIKKICSTFSANLESIDEITRINLMEKVSK